MYAWGAHRRRSIVVVVMVAVLVAVGWFAGPQARAAAVPIMLNGTATITLGVNNYCDFTSSSPRRVGTKKFQYPVTVSVDEPRRGGGVEEPNPVHVFVGTSGQGSEGTFTLTTADSFATSGGDVLLTYWDIAYDSAGGAVSGTLTDTHVQEAAAANMLFVTQDLVPCRSELGQIPFIAAMGEGTALRGTIDSGDAAIQIVGRSIDGLFDYQIDIRAS